MILKPEWFVKLRSISFLSKNGAIPKHIRYASLVGPSEKLLTISLLGNITWKSSLRSLMIVRHIGKNCLNGSRISALKASCLQNTELWLALGY